MSAALRLPCTLTVGQVAEQLQVCLKTIRRWTMAKELHVHRLGSRRLRIAEDDLLAFLNQPPLMFTGVQ